MNREDDEIGIIGEFQIIETDMLTGIETVVYEEHNKVVNHGFRSLLSGVVVERQSPFGFGGIVLGDDIGNGTVDDPERASGSTSEHDQEVVYEIPKKDVFVDYPGPTRLRFTTVIDGDDLFRKTQTDRNMFTSASIRNMDGEVVAYRRFSGRTSSPLLALNIRWTLSLSTEAYDYVPFDPIQGSERISGLIFYVLDTDTSDSPSTEVIDPVELRQGEGKYTTQHLLQKDEEYLELIVLQDKGGGDLVALEWNNGTLIDPLGIMTQSVSGIGTTLLSGRKPYILRIRQNQNSTTTLTVCVGTTCSNIRISR